MYFPCSKISQYKYFLKKINKLLYCFCKTNFYIKKKKKEFYKLFCSSGKISVVASEVCCGVGFQFTL